MVQNNKWYFNFSFLWVGQILSLLASSIVQFVLIWWLTEKTGSAIYLTMATLALFIPDIFIGPLLSPIIDRCNRKKILIASGFGMAFVSILLGVAFRFELITPLMILFAIFARAIFNVVRWPTLEATATRIVPESHLTQVNAIDYIARGISGIIGPILGALFLRTIPMEKTLAADLIAAVGGMIPLFFIRFPSIAKKIEQNLNLRELWQRSISELKSGFNYVKRTPGLLLLLGYVSFTNMLLIPAESLLSLMVFKHFHGTETDMSIIGVAFGIGVVAGGLLLSIWKGFSSRIKTSISGDLLFGFGVLLVGISSPDQFPLAVFGWGLAGIGESLSLANINALLQAHTRPEMQGRVFSISTSLINLSIPVAMIFSGPVAQTLGVHVWYIFSGLGILLLSGSMMFIPAIFRFEKNTPVRKLDPSCEKTC